MEEFERMAGELNEQEDLPIEAPEAVIERANARGDAERIEQERRGPGTEVLPHNSSASEAEVADAASPRAEAGSGSPVPANGTEPIEQSENLETLTTENADKGAGA